MIAATATATAAFTAPRQPQTRIEADETTGTIRFIVNGNEQARIDANGMHVRQDVEFGGTVKDTGGKYLEGRRAQ